MPRRKDKKRYELYFTRDEWKKIEWLTKQYCARNHATFIRNRVLNGKVVIENIEDIENILKEINQIGVNINQIAKALNILSKSTVSNKQDIMQVKLLAKQCLDYQQNLYELLQDRLFVTRYEVAENDGDI